MPLPVRDRGTWRPSAISVLQASKARRTVAYATKDDEDTIAAIEDMVTRKSKKAERQAKKAATAGENKPFQQDSALKEALEGGNLTEAQGFLPDSVDQWIGTNVYTAFSPTIILFLACSSVYGVWKTRQE